MARPRPHSPVALLLIAVVALLLTACQGPQLSALLTPEVYRQRLDENFTPGMTLAQVQARLDEMEVSDRYRLVYPATPTRPEVLLVRTYDPGGPWPQNDQINWVDASFVFDGSGRLERVLTYRDGVGLGFGGQIVSGPSRPTMGGDPHAKWFATIPPPADPLEGAS